VLAPWLDADPGAVLPGRGRVAALLAVLPGGVSGGVMIWRSGGPA